MFKYLLLSLAIAQNPTQIQNGKDAAALDAAKFNNKEGGACTGTGNFCIGDKVGICQNGKFTVTATCGATLSCQVLPLVNKAGTSVTCDTEADKLARFAAAGVNTGSNTGAQKTQGATDQTATDQGATDQTATDQTTTDQGNTNNQNTNNADTTVHVPNSFECIDDTSFKLFTSPTTFIINKCPPGFCATRNPPTKNPCIGKANAARIDGAENKGAAPATAPSNTGNTGNTGNSASLAHVPNSFECIDDTKFKMFTSATTFVEGSCPPGFCATRNPPTKNPCVGKANAARIDKQEN
ncbi:hypothetical protein HDV04_000788 [Boothiomyces sp. JEL0838]|nr:hypothetical protein HDV04_000788 [Boothiomyces sp. JEL0838]